MNKIVVLNFEDEDISYTGGKVTPFVTRNKTETSKPTLPNHLVGSAQSTVSGVLAKVRAKETTQGKTQVHYYSCVRLIDLDKKGLLTRDDVHAIRRDIGDAKKTYIIMHGTPDNTEDGFANGGAQVATWRDLSRLALMLFPAKDEVHRISLIMCYGARTDNYRLNHVGQMSPGDLKTSFAYKFFRAICQLRNVTLTACTGAVSTSADSYANEVETEEWVSATLDIIDYKKDTTGRNNLKLAFDQTKASYLTQKVGLQKDWDDLVSAFDRDPKKVPVGPYETEIHRYKSKTLHLYTQLQANKNAAAQLHGGLANISKYGRIAYHYDGVLQIVNKYGDPKNPTIGEDHLLYRGPLL